MRSAWPSGRPGSPPGSGPARPGTAWPPRWPTPAGRAQLGPGRGDRRGRRDVRHPTGLARRRTGRGGGRLPAAAGRPSPGAGPYIARLASFRSRCPARREPPPTPSRSAPISWPVTPTRTVHHPHRTPVLDDVAGLADWLNVSIADLAWFADTKGMDRRAADRRLRHYRYLWLNGRLVEAPKPRLRAIQRQILAEILGPVPTHPAAHGFDPARSPHTFAAPHAGQRIVIRLDVLSCSPRRRPPACTACSVPSATRTRRLHADRALHATPRRAGRLELLLCYPGCTRVWVPPGGAPDVAAAGAQAVGPRAVQLNRVDHRVEIHRRAHRAAAVHRPRDGRGRSARPPRSGRRHALPRRHPGRTVDAAGQAAPDHRGRRRRSAPGARARTDGGRRGRADRRQRGRRHGRTPRGGRRRRPRPGAPAASDVQVEPTPTTSGRPAIFI